MSIAAVHQRRPEVSILLYISGGGAAFVPRVAHTCTLLVCCCIHVDNHCNIRSERRLHMLPKQLSYIIAHTFCERASAGPRVCGAARSADRSTTPRRTASRHVGICSDAQAHAHRQERPSCASGVCFCACERGGSASGAMVLAQPCLPT